MKTLRLLAMAALSGMIGLGSQVSALAADFVTKQHGVTVTVSELLSITADTSNFTLTFTGLVANGSESDTKTVVYTLKSNNMRQADGAAAINANIDAALAVPIELDADVGAYTKVSGNTEIAEQAAGFVKINTTNTTIGKKANTTAGSDGKILDGTLPIIYKAKATGAVSKGDYVNQLFVTLTTV